MSNTLNNIIIVMAGLVPAIHVFIISTFAKDVDARHKAGHDDKFEMLTS